MYMVKIPHEGNKGFSWILFLILSKICTVFINFVKTTREINGAAKYEKLRNNLKKETHVYVCQWWKRILLKVFRILSWILN